MGMRSARGRRSIGPVLVLVVALGASACTSDDGGSQAAEELPVEVEGEVLDRRDDADDADGTDDADEPEVEEADADADDEDETTAAGGSDDADAGDAEDTGGSDPGSSSVHAADGGGTSGTAPARPSPRPSPSREPAAAPSPAPAPRPSPAPEPTPAATPAPRTLKAGPAESTGPVLSSDGTAWTETSSTSFEPGAEPPPLTVAMRSGDDAPQRQVRCQAALEAPSDRGLAARGTLTVSLRIVTADGAVQVVPRQRIDLDVVLAAGQRRQLAASPARTVDVADVRQVTCVAELTD